MQQHDCVVFPAELLFGVILAVIVSNWVAHHLVGGGVAVGGRGGRRDAA